MSIFLSLCCIIYVEDVIVSDPGLEFYSVSLHSRVVRKYQGAVVIDLVL